MVVAEMGGVWDEKKELKDHPRPRRHRFSNYHLDGGNEEHDGSVRNGKLL